MSTVPDAIQITRLALCDPSMALRLARLHAAEWRGLYVAWDVETARAEFACERPEGGIPQTLVAQSPDGRLLGSVSLIRDDLPSRPDLNPWLASLLVLPEHRGSGIGQKLVRAAESVFATLGERTFYAFTEHAAGFFLRLGFERLGNGMAGGHPVAILRRSLA